ncbi:MAG TPA: hypothetical protein VKP08_00775, partial [Anaerolineales bacterium]|nr:hypothetical protein [Anaerolineales bacterium]
ATVLAVLGLIGIASRLLRRDYLLPLWMAIPFFVEGRSAAGPAAIPLAMLAAVGLVDVVWAAMHAWVGKDHAEQPQYISSVERNITIYLLIYLLFSTYEFGLGLSSATLYPPDQEAMLWVRENTPAETRFLVLTGTTQVSCDSVLEWFPALTGRQSLYTVQGTEWTEGKNFTNYVLSTYGVQECLSSGDGSCLDSAIDRSRYDYIYLSKVLRVNNCLPLEMQRTFPYFLETMKAQTGFDIVYETDEVVVYRKGD